MELRCRPSFHHLPEVVVAYDVLDVDSERMEESHNSCLFKIIELRVSRLPYKSNNQD